MFLIKQPLPSLSSQAFGCSRCHVENTHVGPFLIVKKLGRNRRQKVYHARQTEQDRDVALKFISIPPTIEWSSALDKIEREVNELQKLKHPNLVQVYGAGVSDENKIFFATELVEGESLTSVLSRRGKLTTDPVSYTHLTLPTIYSV